MECGNSLVTSLKMYIYTKRVCITTCISLTFRNCSKFRELSQYACITFYKYFIFLNPTAKFHNLNAAEIMCYILLFYIESRYSCL